MQSQNRGGLPSHVFLVMVTVVPILGIVGPLVMPTETQISSILVMEVVHDIHGALKLRLVMVLLTMGILVAKGLM